MKPILVMSLVILPPNNRGIIGGINSWNYFNNNIFNHLQKISSPSQGANTTEKPLLVSGFFCVCMLLINRHESMVAKRPSHDAPADGLSR